MSEKRFTLHLPIDEKDGTMGYIVDHCNKTTYFIRGKNARKDLVNLLNELAEENEQLKKEHKIAIDEMITDYKNLEKENEQLKYDNFMFKGVIKTFQKVAISERKKLERQVDEQHKIIEQSKRYEDGLWVRFTRLEKENEQLRQQHQRLYNYFRDYLEDEMSAENFGEMWDNVKEDERWNTDADEI